MHTFLARDPDIIVDEIMSAESDLHDRTRYKSQFERQQLRSHIDRLQSSLRAAYAQSNTCSKS